MAKAKATTTKTKTKTTTTAPKKTTPKKEPTVKSAPAPSKPKPQKITKTFSEVFESDVNASIAAWVAGNGAKEHRIVSDERGNGSVVKVVEIEINPET